MKACTERPQRQRCRGRVVIHSLGGGPSMDGELVDIGGGGVCVTLDRPLPEGEVVRLIFPTRPGEPRGAGRTMLGAVTHVRTESGRQVVGIAFSWDTGLRVKTLRVDHRADPPTRLKSWLRRIGIGRPARAGALNRAG